MRTAMALVLLVGCGEVKNMTPDAAKSDGMAIDQSIAIDAPADADLRPHTVFITSTTYSGNLAGLAGADAICAARAQAATLSGTYKAWLADANLSPMTRMTHGLGPYQLVTGTAIAQNWMDLVDGTLSAPVNRTEAGTLLGGSGCSPGPNCPFICEGGEYWSNVNADGTHNTATGDCTAWTGPGSGTAGNMGKTGLQWTQGTCSSIGCSSTLPIMCVQQ